MLQHAQYLGSTAGHFLTHDWALASKWGIRIMYGLCTGYVRRRFWRCCIKTLDFKQLPTNATKNQYYGRPLDIVQYNYIAPDAIPLKAEQK